MNRRPTAGRRGPASPESTKRIPPLWWSLAALVACLALLAAAVAGSFKVSRVQIVGAVVPSDAVAATGVLGDNIFTVQSDRIVTSLASIQEIDVRRVDTSFPNTVTVYVRPRHRFLAWQNGPNLYELDPDGRIIRPVQSTDLPVIRATGSSQALPTGIVQATRYAAETLPSAPSGSVAGFQLDASGRLVISGRAGWVAYLGEGSAQTLVDRVAELDAILRSPEVQRHRLRLADLSSGAPFIRYAAS